MRFGLSMNTGTRISAAFGVFCVLMTMLAGMAGWQIYRMRADMEAVPEVLSVRARLAEWHEQTAINAARTVVIMQSSDLGLGDRLAGPMKQTSERISAVQKNIETLPLSDTERKLFADIGKARKQYLDARDDLIKKKKEGAADAASLYEASFVPALAAYSRAGDAFLKQYFDEEEAQLAAARAAASSMLVTVGGVGAAFFAIAITLALLLPRTITRPLARAVKLTNAVADGDLTQDITSDTKDEAGQVLSALKRMNEQLQRIVTDVRERTQSIAVSSRQMAAGNQDLSQRTEEQASSLEETAASMEELTSTVKQNADNARQANQLAASASEVAIRGGSVVGEVVTTMGAINDSSRKIADIIGVIDGIAFQTNILALNAAVEAARAGEQGRGFAVVASEVRNLAQRSAGAAKEIKALIEDSVGKVEAGSKLVDQAGSTMSEVVHAIKQVTDIVAEITAATDEQSSGIAQVNDAITQMDHVTQQNAALVEEAAAAAESMQAQAQQLAAAVAVFKVHSESTAAPLAPTAPAASPRASEKKSAPRVERRGPSRAKNVTRIGAKKRNDAAKAPPVAAATGTHDDWTEF